MSGELAVTRRALAAVEVHATLAETGGCTAGHLETVHGPRAIAAVIDLLWAGRAEGRQLPHRVGWGYVSTEPPTDGRRRGMRPDPDALAAWAAIREERSGRRHGGVPRVVRAGV